jgi:hypothetical protein
MIESHGNLTYGRHAGHDLRNVRRLDALYPKLTARVRPDAGNAAVSKRASVCTPNLNLCEAWEVPLPQSSGQPVKELPTSPSLA